VAGVVLTGIGAAGVHDLIAVKAAGGLPRVQDAR
jgi:chemotaxis response regulator CheB